MRWLQHSVGNQAVLALLRQPVQRIRLPVGGTTVETDYYSIDQLEQGMVYGVRKTPRATEAEKAALREEIRRRQGLEQWAAPGSVAPRTTPDRADFEATMRRNEASRERLRLFVERSLTSTDPLLRNSCEWVRRRRVKLYAGTDLIDANDRMMGVLNSDLSQFAKVADLTLIYPNPEGLPGTDVYSQQQPYDWEAPFSEPGLTRLTKTVVVEPVGTKGWYRNGQVVVVVERVSSETDLVNFLTQVLKHEVQHAADLSEHQAARLGPRSPANLLEHAKRDFETEFRAYSLMGLPEVERADANRQVAFRLDRNFQVSERHDKIVGLLWGRDLRQKYEDPEAEDAVGPYLKDDELEQLFAYMATARPLAEAVNEDNSIRIDAFYAALAPPTRNGVLSAYLHLEASEREAMKTKPGMTRHVRSQLASTVAMAIWARDVAMWAELERQRKIVLAATSLSQMYAWSHQHLLTQVTTGQLDHLVS